VTLYGGLDDKTQCSVHREVYARVHAIPPAGRDSCEESSPRRHTMEKLCGSLDLFSAGVTGTRVGPAPRRLRHSIGPRRGLRGRLRGSRAGSQSTDRREGFRWPSSLVSLMLARAVDEVAGSNGYSYDLLIKAVGNAPRGKRTRRGSSTSSGPRPACTSLRAGLPQGAGAHGGRHLHV